MKTVPIVRSFDSDRQIGTITFNDDVVLMGDEILAWEAVDQSTDPVTGETKGPSHFVLSLMAVIKSKDVLTRKEKYGMEPSEIKIEMK